MPVPYKYEAALSERLSDTLGESVPGGFSLPWGLAFDSSGDLFVADDRIIDVEPSDAQIVDCGGKFLAPQLAKFLIAARGAPMGRSCSGRETNDAGFNPALPVETQGAAKAAGFVIRVRGNHHHALHAGIVT